MIPNQAPAGARDLLPLEVAQKSWINDKIQEVFQRWGYKRIVTSTIEWIDTLMAGDAIQPYSVIQLQDLFEGRMGLRPELTASIARAAITRMDVTSAKRLCYRANVFRNPPKGYHGRQLEFYQAGVELLFTGGVLADAEIILLIADCLRYLGLENWQLLLGEAGLTTSLLSVIPNEQIRQKVRHCIANLDRVTLEKLSLSPELKERVLLLFDLRGNPEEVLSKVSNLELDSQARECVNNLKSLIELVNQSSSQSLPIVLDLSLVQTFDYYTGIVFDVVSFKGSKPYVLGQGGRYDQLLGVYHPQGEIYPGIGFSLNIEDLHSCLLDSPQIPKQTPPSDWLVIPENSEAMTAAFLYAQKLRKTENIVRVELDLEYRNKSQILAYAQNEGINCLAWLKADGTPTIETLF
jgi:ATP phosphoribosyltransferase regulatory subunit